MPERVLFCGFFVTKPELNPKSIIFRLKSDNRLIIINPRLKSGVMVMQNFSKGSFYL